MDGKAKRKRVLSEKEREFVRRIVVEKEAQVSAFRAVYAMHDNDHERHIRSKIQRVLDRPHVQAEIARLRSEVESEAMKRAIWTRDDSVAMLAEIARQSHGAAVVTRDGEQAFNAQANAVAVKAVAELGKMLGFNEAEKSEAVIRIETGDDLDI